MQKHDTAQQMAQLTVGTVGIGVGFIEQVVHWAQIISVVGGAIIVIITLLGMVLKAIRKLRGK
jgi:hypothetical protein